MHQLLFTDKAKEQIDTLRGKLKRQVENALRRIAANPRGGKPLSGELKGIWSERVSAFRILYRIREQMVEVVILLIEHRSTVYGGH